MPRFAAFAGIRYATDDLAAVTAPPYDVIDDAERSLLEARHPDNVVHINRHSGPMATPSARSLVEGRAGLPSPRPMGC